ncbi:MAG: hypothetical protein IJJ71_02475 [Treponema sp.]|uniref:hypothetical protein n=1 Tax=Treponema sp. TaxID=166 RepID=UPI0025D0F6E5|nr:hypothetical protein [Treponema sp.]MBR0495025.1 hypothetical protein [Treponema sp.]
MKKLFKLQALLAAILMAFSFASCSGDDDDDDSPSKTTYTGSFSLAGANYTTLNIMSDGNYTMTGDSDTDRGTWVLASARAVAVGDYIFTSTVHKASDGTNGTFSVSITSTSVTMETGTLTASGTGIVVKKSSGSAPLAGVFVQEEEKNEAKMPHYDQFTFNSDGTFYKETICKDGVGGYRKITYLYTADTSTRTISATVRGMWFPTDIDKYVEVVKEEQANYSSTSNHKASEFTWKEYSKDEYKKVYTEYLTKMEYESKVIDFNLQESESYFLDAVEYVYTLDGNSLILAGKIDLDSVFSETGSVLSAVYDSTVSLGDMYLGNICFIYMSYGETVSIVSYSTVDWNKNAKTITCSGGKYSSNSSQQEESVDNLAMTYVLSEFDSKLTVTFTEVPSQVADLKGKSVVMVNPVVAHGGPDLYELTKQQ